MKSSFRSAGWTLSPLLPALLALSRNPPRKRLPALSTFLQTGLPTAVLSGRLVGEGRGWHDGYLVNIELSAFEIALERQPRQMTLSTKAWTSGPASTHLADPAPGAPGHIDHPAMASVSSPTTATAGRAETSPAASRMKRTNCCPWLGTRRVTAAVPDRLACR